MVTTEQMEKMFKGSGRFADDINKAVEHYNINNTAMFIAQLGHESGGFKVFLENLNYSSQRLLQIFPKYFNAATAKEYTRKPEKIANRVYANRMGNGNEASGDGWRFRGKGAIQLTGKSLHELFAKDYGLSLDEAVQYMMTEEGAIMSAGWYWKYANCNPTSSDIKITTKKINGGYNGLEERTVYYNKAKKIFI